jgi:hypothetical protein
MWAVMHWQVRPPAIMMSPMHSSSPAGPPIGLKQEPLPSSTVYLSLEFYMLSWPRSPPDPVLWSTSHWPPGPVLPPLSGTLLTLTAAARWSILVTHHCTVCPAATCLMLSAATATLSSFPALPAATVWPTLSVCCCMVRPHRCCCMACTLCCHNFACPSLRL